MSTKGPNQRITIVLSLIGIYVNSTKVQKNDAKKDEKETPERITKCYGCADYSRDSPLS
jgi:hypothetical protein